MLIPVHEIWADQINNKSREPFTPESCESLAATIAEHGLMQPVTVVPWGKDGFPYKLVFGYRRFTAVALILAEKDIEAIVRDDIDAHQADVMNALENIERSDLSFFEECVALKNIFPADSEQTAIGKTLKKSRTWVRVRWLMWKLPEEVIEQVRIGLLTAADVSLLIQQTPERQAAAAEKIRRGKARGEATRSMEKSLSNRKSARKQRDMQRMMTILMERGLIREMHVLRYAAGEINENQLLEYLDDSSSRPGNDGAESAEGSGVGDSGGD